MIWNIIINIIEDIEDNKQNVQMKITYEALSGGNISRGYISFGYISFIFDIYPLIIYHSRNNEIKQLIEIVIYE